MELSNQAKFVAEALLNDGFRHCGKAEDFCTIFNLEDEDIEAADGWLVEGSYQELGLDAVCEGELFFKELPSDCDRNKFETELERIKQLIVKVESDWISTCC